MAYQPFYIEAFKTGLEKDKASFQLLPDAFSELQDAFIYRDRLSRKKGHAKVCRLTRVLSTEALGNTTGTPHTGNIKTILSLETDSELSQTSISITVAAPNTETFTEPAVPDGTLVGDGGGLGTINYITGAFSITSGAGWAGAQAVTIDFDYYPALPCMGLYSRELVAANSEQSVAFDTKYIYFYSNTSNRFEENGSGITWQGSDSDFFFANSYYSGTALGDVFIVTNFNKSATPDPIRYYDTATSTWTTFAPSVDGIGNELHQALTILPYKGRLVALNIWEGATLVTSSQERRRVRWSQNGDAFAADAWRSDIAGKGGYLDAPTSEKIISAEFIKDTLIVGFEKSVYKLRYTGNEILPFLWEKISNEYGIESTYSVTNYDMAQLAIGEKGIIACDPSEVVRIDKQIPDEVFNIHNENEGLKRVHAIRDYDKNLIYWTIPTSRKNRTYPDKVLVFSYENMAWSYFKDSYTCLGVLQEGSDETWASLTDVTWEMAEYAWNRPSHQSLYPSIIAGNQNGYILKIQQYSANEPSFAITDITAGTPVQLTIPDHNLSTNDYISVSTILGTASSLNDTSYKVNFVDEDTISLSDHNGIPITLALGSTYIGGGEISWLHDFVATSKKYNFLKEGKSTELGYIDFLVNKTEDGMFTVDIYADHDNSYPININDTFFNNVVHTSQYSSDIGSQDKLIHRLYARSRLQFLQFKLSLTGSQKVESSIHDSDISIFSMIIWTAPRGRLV